MISRHGLNLIADSNQGIEPFFFHYIQILF